MSRTILGLDVGTAQIKAVVAEPLRNGGVKICEAIKVPSQGVRKGEVVDIEEVAHALKEIFTPVKERYKSSLREIFVNIGGPHTNVHNSRGVIALSREDNEIYQTDVEKVIKGSQDSVASPNRAIIHTETKEFTVDAISGITDPVGLVGRRLEVHSLMVDVFTPFLKNISQSIELVGGELAGILFGTIAASRVSSGYLPTYRRARLLPGRVRGGQRFGLPNRAADR